jgi:cytochrome P450
MRVPTALGRSVGSVIDMQDESQNTALKRGVGSAFTAKAVLAYENDCNAIALELIQTIQAYSTLDLFPTLQFFQLDFLTKMAFSENYGHLKQRRDVWGVAGSTRHRVTHWIRWQGMSKLEYFLYQHPFWCKFWKIPQSSNWVKEALGQLNSRRNTAIGLPTFTAPKTDLLQAYVDAAVKRPDIKPETIALMTTSTIGAGFDTTAHALTTVLFLLIKHPRILKKLRDELASTHLSQPIPHWDEVNKLTYLDAIWKESMRYNPFLNISLERVVPATGLEICGKSIPPGTIVGAQPLIVHHDPNVFGNNYPVDDFQPERWIEANDEQRLAMERGSLGFGSGKRVCLGRHIADMEIKKVIPALVRRFDVSRGGVFDDGNTLTLYSR